MSKHGKKYVESVAMIDKTKNYTVSEAVDLMKKTSNVKFDATVELAIKTNANPKYNDQMIRSTIILPHGTGKTKRVAVFVTDERLDEAKKSGADVVGSSDLMTEIKSGNMDFDILLTTPDSIRELAPIAKILGPKGLMPSPKAGTVVADLKQSVEEFKKGKIEYKLDKTGNIHLPVGKVSFDEKKLVENIELFLSAINENKPSGIKGKLIRKAVVSSSMGPGIVLDYTSK
ncbi:MAG TPA: 50S ribosomal protein L1 [Candidatus Absconditabacterales bacterium]|nr:50S ribosomal protein L1 [Candidatus Absconditabacterales bacterium]